MSDTGEALDELFGAAIEQLCAAVDNGGRAQELLAIGFITSDDVCAVEASLLFSGDLPPDAERYRRLSPVEWLQRHERSFDALNRKLTAERSSGETESDYERRVRRVFDACALALTELNLPGRFGPSLFLTFAGVDPNRVLEAEEKRFVGRMNSTAVFDSWCDEFG